MSDGKTIFETSTWYSLLGYLTANPLVCWSWGMWVANGIHDDVSLRLCSFVVCYIGILINDEEEVHQVASNPATVWENMINNELLHGLYP